MGSMPQVLISERNERNDEQKRKTEGGRRDREGCYFVANMQSVNCRGVEREKKRTERWSPSNQGGKKKVTTLVAPGGRTATKKRHEAAWGEVRLSEASVQGKARENE